MIRPLSVNGIVVDISQPIVTSDHGGQEIALIRLHANRDPGSEEAVVGVNLSWLREGLRAAYWGERPAGSWRKRYRPLSASATPMDIPFLALWPVVKPGAADRALQVAAQGRDSALRRVALHDLADGLSFPLGLETSILQYPEIVAGIDGTCCRFPEVYFIGSMTAVTHGESLERDPDWFRTFEDRPSRWRGKQCPLCGCMDGEVRHVIGPSRIVRCECGLEREQPQAIVETTALNKYASDIADRRAAARSIERARQSAQILMRGLDRLGPEHIGGPLLDLGCASGEMLMVLREEHGWPAERLRGVEPAPRSVEIARGRHGLNVVQTTLTEAALPDDSMAVVSIVNTFEHLAEPNRVLDEVRRILQPGGILAILTVPNVDCLASQLFPEGWIAKQFPDGQHHYHYTPDTLRRICEDHGFESALLEGETREPVMGMVRETVAWLAQQCGVGLEALYDTDALLRELEERVRAFAGEHGGPDVREDDFTSADSVVDFWWREVWASSHLSDEFDLWLRLS